MDFEKQRQRMVQQQLVRRGIRDEAVLEAMGTVPREAFLPADMAEMAYEDSPLPSSKASNWNRSASFRWWARPVGKIPTFRP
ncbi:MAG TPA: hypothetical protein ACFCUC_06525 [Desulfobacterales bacterium]